MRSISTRTRDTRSVSQGKYFVDDAIQDMENDNFLQSEFVKAVESAVPHGLVGGVKAKESEHVFNLFDSIIELTTKARAGVCFSKFKEEYTNNFFKRGDNKSAFRGKV